MSNHCRISSLPRTLAFHLLTKQIKIAYHFLSSAHCCRFFHDIYQFNVFDFLSTGVCASLDASKASLAEFDFGTGQLLFLRLVGLPLLCADADLQSGRLWNRPVYSQQPIPALQTDWFDAKRHLQPGTVSFFQILQLLRR